ncbi:MAG: peptidyl-prolyl cis-trans isomerase [Sandaracinaceae bacterium]|nr:peptidyl-prolyl cis-trans isomerase [Sandaracinaceae bacterium]
MRPRTPTRRALTALALLLSLGGASLLGPAAQGQPAPARRRAQGHPTATAAPAGSGAGQGALGPSASPASAPDATEEQARRDQVFARLGDVTLTLGEIEDDVQRRSPFARRQFADRERLVEHARELFRAKLLAHAAEARGYAERPAVRTLVDRHLVATVVRRQIDEPNGPSHVTDEDARAYFDAHQELFVRAEQRRVSHILVETEERAAELLAQVRAGDLRAFRRLAQSDSLDTETNQRGGDLGYFAADGTAAGSTDAPVDADIVRLAFTLTREEPIASAPLEVTTSAGPRYSIVRLTGIREGAHPSFEDVLPTVRRRVAVESRDGAYRAYIAHLRESHRVEMQPLEVLRDISLPPPPMPAHNHRGAEPETEEQMAAEGAAHMAP